MSRFRKFLLRWILPSDFVFQITTHKGFYSPCDDDHCHETRHKFREMLR